MTPPPSRGYERLLRGVFAVSIVGGPLGYLVGGLLAPGIHVSGASTISANAAANPLANGIHLASFVIASFLLPVGAMGLAVLVYERSPRLATIAGVLGVLGWLPFSGLTALDDLARAMAQLPGSSSYAALLDDFTNDVVMNTYLIVYIVFHLVAYVLFGIALLRGRVIAAWAGWSMIASSPLTIAAFALPVDRDSIGRAIGGLAIALLLLGSLPAARVMAGRGSLFSR